MTLLTDLQYRERTGDGSTTTPPIHLDACLAWGQNRIQEYLGRYLEWGTYTEILELDRYGKAYPAAIPVTEVSASADVTMIGDDCMYFGPQWPEYDMITERSYVPGYDTRTVTYSGGFTLANCPEAILDAICALAYWKAHTRFNPTNAQGMATQIRVGDVALGFDAKTRRTYLDSIVPGITDLISGYHLGRL
jgi:hypothetical protein